ncbi:MAG: hypothetical protein IPG45_39185 [Deltaproteobacteria bacterium]|nr:hypothetical protein [Deltaproteobacteria bacterium]
MANREWNPKSFFRHLTPDALEVLLEWAAVELTLDGEGPVGEQVYRGWKALPEAERVAIETKLLPVNDLCGPHARPYLERLAQQVWTNGHSQLVEDSRGWSAQDLAVRLFVADEARFLEAHQAHALDMMEHLTEFHGRYPVTLKPTAEAKTAMKAAMASHFRETAFGARCQVEDFANDEKFALFIFHEDEVAPFDRFNDKGIVEPDWQRPVVRLAAVFQFETSTLLVKAPRVAEREKLRDLFAEIFVGDAAYLEDTNKSPKFSFDPLRDDDFDFPVRGFDKIEDVSIVRVVAKPASRDVKRVTVEMKPGFTVLGVRGLLGEHGVDLASDAIHGVRLQFIFEGKGRSKYRTVSLFNPNSSNLNDTERDRVIRRYLKEWGIDASGRRSPVEVTALEAAAQ